MNDYLVERKYLPFEIKDVTEQGVIKGMAAAIGNVDEGGDRILAGAFDKSIARSKGIVPIYWGHAWERIPLGYGTSASADQKALNVEGELTMNIPAVRDAYESVAHAKKVGFVMGISIGYRIPPKGYEMVENVRELKEIDVYEWSVTPFPMNKRARVTGLKSIDSFTERDFEEFLRDAGYSSREAKTIISRGFRALLNDRSRDANGDGELPPQLKELSERLQLDRWLAERRHIILRG